MISPQSWNSALFRTPEQNLAQRARLGDSKKAREMAEETKHLKQTELDEALEIQKTRLERFQPVP